VSPGPRGPSAQAGGDPSGPARSARAGGAAPCEAPPAPVSPRRSRLVVVVLAAVLVLAALLRLKGIAWGLPLSLVNVDESTVLPKAFGVARGGLDPQFFYYPSFFFYLVGAVYLLAAPVLWAVRGVDPLAMASFVTDPTPYFVLGRLVSAAAGTASVYLVYRLGREAFGRPAGLVAALLLAVAPLHVAYSHMAVTDVTATALSLLALLLLLQAARGAGGRRLIAGAVVAGLATSTKYNLGLLVLPATVAAAYACREQVAARLAARRAARGPGGPHLAAFGRAALAWARPLLLRVYLPMLVAFVLGSPFIVLDPGHFRHDFLRQNRIMARGWLGFENAGNGLWYNLHVNLWAALGAVLLVLGLAGLVWALWRHRPFDLMVAPYVIVYVAYVSTWKELADRYLLPVVPLLILLAVRFCVELATARPAWRRVGVPVAAALLAVALVAPVRASLAFDRGLSGPDTRAQATAWIEANVPTGATVAVETSGPQLRRVADRRYYRQAGRLASSFFNVVRLGLPAPGMPNRSHDLDWVRSSGAQYVVVSSKVYDRVLAAAAHYPSVVAFYRDLDRRATLVKTFSPGPDERGPTIKVYRLGRSAPDLPA
jgi:4-amino-4-deoxy-L-arabinose transferase-like glycosyltransferase